MSMFSNPTTWADYAALAKQNWGANLSTRTTNVIFNCLRGQYAEERIAKAGPAAIAALCARQNDASWLREPNFGKTSLKELKDFCAANGAPMGGEVIYVVLVHHTPIAAFKDEKSAEACRASHIEQSGYPAVSVYPLSVISQ